LVDSKNEPVVVIGLGRFGSAIAAELTRRGTEVLAIDSSARRVQAMAAQLTQVVTADSTDIEALREIGVPDFYRAIVAIGGDVEASILTTSLLIELEIADVWAKAISSHHGRILDRIGAHHVVFPEHEMGERVAHLVSGQLLDYMQIDRDFALAKIRPPREVVGIPLGKSRLRSRFKITAVAVKRSDGSFTYVSDETTVTQDDVIFVVGREDDIERLVHVLRV
jgi:trk system potassium uptake protein